MTDNFEAMDAASRVSIDDHLQGGGGSTLRDDVIAGMTERPYSLPPKWFYDAAGSEIFEEITRLVEYYPTEAERSALRLNAADIVAASRADTLVELGSGISDKTQVLLDAMAKSGASDQDPSGRSTSDGPAGLTRYVPFDVSAEALRDAAQMIALRYPTTHVHGVVGDFDHHIEQIPHDGNRMVAFLGGTLGNYDSAGRAELLTTIAHSLDVGETFLLGTDLVKSVDRLIDAYDDASGVTARFNLNLLTVLNRELGADFDTSTFEHLAVWNQQFSRIEMRLRSTIDQTVSISGANLVVPFERGEDLLTEISSKFTRESITLELKGAGLEVIGWYCDPAEDFALSLSTRP